MSSIVAVAPAPGTSDTAELEATVLSQAELEQFKEYIEAIKAAYHRALTRQSLKKYDYEHRESSKLMSERYGRILGYSLLDKPGGYGDIVEVKTLKEYKLQQTLTVEEAMANTVPEWEEERRAKLQTVHILIKQLLEHVRETNWLPAEQHEPFTNIVLSDFAARYHDLRLAIANQTLSAASCRTIITSFFKQLKEFIDLSLEYCRERQKKMEKRGVFSVASNWLRLHAFFRAELSKRAKTDQLIRTAIGKVVAPGLNRRQSELLRFGLQSLTDAMPQADFSLVKDYKPAALEIPSRHGSGVIIKTSMSGTTLDDSSDSDTMADRQQQEPHENPQQLIVKEDRLTFYQDLDAMLLERQPKKRTDTDDGGIMLNAKLHEIEERKQLPSLLKYRTNDRYLNADEERRNYMLDFEEFNAILEAEPEMLVKAQRIASATGKSSFEKGMERMDVKGKNVGDAYLSRFSERSLKGNSSAIVSDRSLGEKLSLTFDPTFLEKLDDQVMKLKEIDEIYHELLRSEMADCYEMIDDKADPENYPSIPFEYNAVLNISHLGKGNGQNTSSKPLGYAPQPEEIDKGALVFEDYLMFLQNRPNDYVSEVLTPISADPRLISTPIVVATDDIQDAVEDGSKTEKFKKGYWNASELDQKNLETSSLLLQMEQEALRLARHKGARPVQQSDTEIPLVLDDGSSETSSIRVGSSAGRTSRSAIYDPVTGMPINDDGNQPVRLLDGERRLDPEDMDYMESQKIFQEQLERIWNRFKMPMSQRLDMAMKYGKKTDNRRLLDRALPVWDQTASLIESREKILIKLKEFEEKQINPTRFRRKNAEELERESAERQRILTKLEKTNKALEKCIQTIRFSLKDEVTYNGEVYREKMKHDYSNILYEVVQNYKDSIPSKIDSRPTSPGPSSSRASTSSVSLAPQQQPQPKSK